MDKRKGGGGGLFSQLPNTTKHTRTHKKKEKKALVAYNTSIHCRRSRVS